MADLKSMKITKAELKERRERFKGSPDEGPKFPFGLSLHLDEESMDKLGVDKLPKVGTKMIMTARVEVTSVHADQQLGGGKNRSMGLQITDLALEGDNAEKSDADIIFGDD